MRYTVPQSESRSSMDANGEAAHELLRTSAVQQLDALTAVLRETVSFTGGKFLDAGSALQSLFKEAESLVQATSVRTDLLGTEEDNPIADIGTAADESVLALKQGQADNRALLTHILDTIGVVKSLSKSVESINGVGSQLGIIGTNLAIQTSRLQSGVETFGDFASEIKSFSAYITRFAADIESDTEEVISILGDVKGKMESKSSDMQVYIEKAGESAALTIREIRTLLHRSSQLLEEKAVLSKEISRHVSDAVVAMQIDDIARQRIEHVDEALSHIARNGDFGEGRAVLKLQASQAREVASDLVAAHTAMSQAFESISDAVQSISPSSQKGRSGEEGAASSLRSLQKTLLGLEKIHEDAKELRDSMSAGLDRAILASETISRHVVDVSTITQELNLKAINALLMSRQLGSDGGNLVVLAKELHTLSKDSIEFVTAVKEKIEHVAEVTTMLKQSTLSREDGSDMRHRFDDKIGAMDESLAFFEDASEEAGRRATAIRRRIEETASELEFLQETARRLNNGAADIDRVFEETAPLAGDFGESDAHIHALYEKYTMEQERRLHRELHGGAEAVEERTQENTSDDDELGDFELF